MVASPGMIFLNGLLSPIPSPCEPPQRSDPATEERSLMITHRLHGYTGGFTGSGLISR